MMTRLNPNATSLNQLGDERARQYELARNFQARLLAASDVAGGVLFGSLGKEGDEFSEAAGTVVGEIAGEAAKESFGTVVGTVVSVAYNSMAPLAALVNPGLKRKESNEASNKLLKKFEDQFYKDYELAKNAPVTALITTNLIKITPALDVLKWILRRTGKLNRFRTFLMNKFTPKKLSDLNLLEPEQEFLDYDFDQKIDTIYSQYTSIENSNASFYAYGEYLTREQCTQSPGLATAYTIARLIKLAKGESYNSYLYEKYFNNTLSNLYAILQHTKVIEHYELNHKVQERIQLINQELDQIAELNPTHLNPNNIAGMISALIKENQSDDDISNILKDLSTKYYNAYKKFNSRTLKQYKSVPSRDEIYENWIYNAWDTPEIQEHIAIFIFNQIQIQDKPNVIASFMKHLYLILNLNTPQEIQKHINSNLFIRLLDRNLKEDDELSDDEFQNLQEIIFSN